MTKTIIPGVNPDYSYDHGAECEVLTLDADDVVALLRHASRGDDRTAREVRELFPVQVSTGTLAGIAGPDYAVRVEVHYDRDAENPLTAWDNLTTFASLDSWGRDYLDLRSDSYESITDQPTRGGRTLGRGNDFTAEAVAREAIHGGESYATDSSRFAYRILHLDGARGITNVATTRDGSLTHCPAAETGQLDHDAVAWVPRGAIIGSAPRPDGATLDYDAATGWRYTFADGASASAEDAVEEWASAIVAGNLGTLSDYLSGSVYGVRVLASTCEEDEDPDDLDARDWDDTPHGDVWGFYGDDETQVNVVGAGAHYHVVESIIADLERSKNLRAKLAKQRAGHARLLETLTAEEAALLRTLWGERFRYLTSARQLYEALKLEGLDLYYTGVDRWPSLGLRKDDDEEGRP